MKQASKRCRMCTTRTLHCKEQFSSFLGLILTCFTVGLFLPLWIVSDWIQPWRCQRCGIKN